MCVEIQTKNLKLETQTWKLDSLFSILAVHCTWIFAIPKKALG